MSCRTSQLTHSVVASLVRSSPVECLLLGSTSWTAREKLLRIVFLQLLGRPHIENKLLHAGQCFTLCLKQVHRHKLRVLVCKHNAKPKPWQWLYSDSSHHVCEHPLQLLFCLGLYHSWYWSLCDLDKCAHIAYIIAFPHFLWCISDHIRLIQMTQSSVPLPCTVKFHAVGTLVLVLPEFPSVVSCSCFLSRKWSYVPTPCTLRLTGLKNSPAHTKHFWVRFGNPLCLRLCWSSHSLCPTLWKPLRWNFWPLIEWAQSSATHRCSSLCDLYNHCPLACLLSSTG